MIDGGLRKLFRQQLRWDWQAIESGVTGSGIPDSNYCAPPQLSGGAGIEGWLEFKRTMGWTVSFRPYQVPWIMRRCRAGGRVHVAVRQVRKGGDVLWIYRGSVADALEIHGLRGVEPDGCWAEPWPWEEIGQVILFTRGPNRR